MIVKCNRSNWLRTSQETRSSSTITSGIYKQDLLKLLSVKKEGVFSDTDKETVLGDYFQEDYSKEVKEEDIILEEDEWKVQETMASPLSMIQETMASPLSMIFYQSLSSGSLLEAWKLAIVTPIFKIGHKSKPENYRLVLLTSIVCKVMETIVKERMVDYIEKNKLFSDNFNAFKTAWLMLSPEGGNAIILPQC